MNKIPEYWLLLRVDQDDAMDGPNAAAIKVTSEFLSTLETAKSIALMSRSFMPEFDYLALKDYTQQPYIQWLNLDDDTWSQYFVIEPERDENRNVVGKEEIADWVILSDMDGINLAQFAAKAYEPRIKVNVADLETEVVLFWLTATDESTGIYYTDRMNVKLLSDPTFYGDVAKKVDDANPARTAG